MIKTKNASTNPSWSPTKKGQNSKKKPSYQFGIIYRKKTQRKGKQNQPQTSKRYCKKTNCILENQDLVVQQQSSKPKQVTQNSIVKKQKQLKRMVVKLQKEVEFLLNELSPRKPMKNYKSPKQHQPIRKSKASKGTNRQTSQCKDQNITSNLFRTKSFPNQNGALAVLQHQKNLPNKKPLSISNKDKIMDFLCIGGKFVRTDQSLISNIKETLHCRQITQVIQNRIQTFFVNQQKSSSKNSGVLDNEIKQKAIKQYYVKKAIVIQKWWRSMLIWKKTVKNRRNNLLQQLKRQIDNEQQSELQRYQEFLEFCPNIRSSNVFDNEVYDGGQYTEGNKKSMSTIPATAKQIIVSSSDESESQIHETSEQNHYGDCVGKQGILSNNNSQIGSIDAVEQRQNAVKIRRDTHIAILKQIKDKKNMDQKLYTKYFQIIQKNYRKQLSQINVIRNIIENNVSKVESIITQVKKNVKQMEIVAQQQIQSQHIIQRIFQSAHSRAESNHKKMFLTEDSYFENAQNCNLDSSIIMFQRKAKKMPKNKILVSEKDLSESRLKQQSQSQQEQQEEQQQYQKEQQKEYEQEQEQQQNQNQKQQKEQIFESEYSQENDALQFPTKNIYAFHQSNVDKDSQSQSPMNQRTDQYFTSFEQERQQQGQQTNCQDYQNRNQFEFSSNQWSQTSSSAIAIEFQENRVKEVINGRVAQQLSMANRKQLPMVQTSLSGISKCLVGFFEQYIDDHKEQFLHFINTPFGENPRMRLARMQNYQDVYQESSEETCIYGIVDVVSKLYYEQYQKSKLFHSPVRDYQKSYESEQESVYRQGQYFAKQSQFFHNMAIYDAFNQALDEMRPYYQTNGENYEWTISEKSLSFYFVTQDAIQSVFYKAQMRILKWASSLCGLIIEQTKQRYPKSNNLGLICDKITCNDSCDHNYSERNFQATLSCYKKCNNKYLGSFHQEKLRSVQILEIHDQNCRLWTNWNQQRTMIIYGLGMLVFEQLLRECSVQLYETNI